MHELPEAVSETSRLSSLVFADTARTSKLPSSLGEVSRLSELEEP